MELISERAAARRLAVCGLSLSATQHLLATGIAGTPVRTAVATLYDDAAVEELASRPAVSYDETKALFPGGAVVVRLPRGRTVRSDGSWPETAEVLRGPWPMPLGPTMALMPHHWRGHAVPLLLTVSGFVMFGASIASQAKPPEGSGAVDVCFEVDEPGAWLPAVRGRSLRFGRGATVELLGRPGLGPEEPHGSERGTRSPLTLPA